MLKLASIMALCGLSSGIAQAQIELWRQNQNPSPGGYSSQDARNPGGLGWFSEAVDDFVSAPGWTINNVQFFGGYVTPVGQEGHTTAFTIRFYSDNGGRPGTRIFEQDVTLFNETLYGVVLGFGAYSYSCNLSPAFTPPTPGVYWMSAVAVLPRGGTSEEPQWGLNQAYPIRGNAGMQWFFQPGNFTAIDSDFGMVLNGTIGTSCYANCDLVGGLTGNDFQCFINAYVAGNSYANCDGVGGLTGNDFQCFLDKYVAGCS